MPSGARPLGSFYVQLGLNTRTFRSNLAAAQRELRDAFGTAAIHASEVLAASITAIGAALAGLGAKAVQMAADLEKQRTALTKLLGTAELATEKIKELYEFSAMTGFEFDRLVEWQKRLMAVGFTAEETKFMLYQIADATAMIGDESEKIDRLIKAFGDVKAKGTLQTQEIKQFGEVGIGAWDMLGKAIGKTKEELVKLVEGRQISSPVALKALTDQFTEQWGGMAEEMAKKLSGSFNRLKSTIIRQMIAIGDWLTTSLPIKDFIDSTTSSIQKLANVITNNGIVEAVKMFGKEFPAITKSLQLIGETIVLLLLPGLASMTMYIATMSVPLMKLVAVGLLIVEVMPRIVSSVIDGFDFLTSIVTEFGLSVKKFILDNFKWFLDKTHELEVSLRMIAYDLGEQIAVIGDNIINGAIKGLSYLTNWILRTIKSTMLTVHKLVEDSFRAFDMYLQAFAPKSVYEGAKNFLASSKARINQFKDDEGTPAQQNVFKYIMGYKETEAGRKEARKAELEFWQQGNKVQEDLQNTITETTRQLKSQQIISDGAFEVLVSGITDTGKDIGNFFGNLKDEAKKLWSFFTTKQPIDFGKRPDSPWKDVIISFLTGNGRGIKNPNSGGKAANTKLTGRDSKNFFGTLDSSLSTDEIHFVGALLPYIDETEKAAYELAFAFQGIPAAAVPALNATAEAAKANLEEIEKEKEELTELEQWVGGIWQSIGTTMNTVFENALLSSGNFFKSVGESLHKLGNQILAQIAQLAIMSVLFNALGIKTSAIPMGLQIFRHGGIVTGGYMGDGVVSDGKIISTHPDDYIIATKDPSSLGGKPNVVVNVNNNSSSEVSTNSYFDGTRTIVDIVIDGLQRNVNGLRDTVRAI